MPFPIGLVVKNGSKMCATVSASMPTPVSLTASMACCAGTSLGVVRRRSRSSSSTLPVSIVSVPPSGIASRALTARLMSTCSSWSGSASTGSSSGSSDGHELDVLTEQPAEHRRDPVDDLVQARESRGCRTCRRLKASSCRVRTVARSAAAAISFSSGSESPSACLLEQRFGVAADHGEQVVEVVGDAAGQPPDRLQLLRLTQLLLEVPALADVAADRLGADGRAVLLDQTARHLDLDPPPVLGEQLVLVHGRLDAPDRPCRCGPAESLVPLGWHELEERTTDQLLARIAERSHERLVHGCEARLQVHGRDQIGGVLEQISVAGLALAQSAASTRLRSVTSREIAEAPTTRPDCILRPARSSIRPRSAFRPCGRVRSRTASTSRLDRASR